MTQETGLRRLVSTLDRHKLDLALLVLILGLAFFIRYDNLMAAGITWDENFYVHSGITYLDNLRSLNFSHSAWTENNEHPPVSKYLYGLAIYLFNGGNYDLNAYYVARTVSVLMGALTCGIVFLLGRELYDRRAGLLAALILAFTPDFVAHTQVAALDSPVAFFFTLTVAIFIFALTRKSQFLFLLTGISLGLLLATKFNGILAIPLLALIYLFYSRAHPEIGAKLKAMFRDTYAWKGLLARVDRIFPLVPFFILLCAAGAIFYVLWPWIWNDPLNFGRSLKHWTVTPSEYLLGAKYQQMPLYYYPVYFLVTTPLLLFLPFAAGLVKAIRSRDPLNYALLAWFAVPFVYGFSVFIQDGMRYLLMIYPAVALLSALGILALAGWVSSLLKRPAAGTIAFWAVGAATVLYLVVTLASCSPYYLDYYNGLPGGPKDIYEHRLFEIGWWGEGIYDSVTYLENSATPGSVVYVAAHPNHQIWLYEKNLTYLCPGTQNATLMAGADYVLVNPFAEIYENVSINQSEYHLVYATEYQGMDLAKVYQRNGG